MEIQKIMAQSEKYREAMVSFLQDLVRIPSVNGRDTEKSVAERIVLEAENLGFTSSLIAKDADRPNATASYGSGDDAFAVIAHIDTVAEGKHDDWSAPPFSAQIINGKMIGRGTADNKAGIACGLYAMAISRDLGLLNPDSHKLILAGVVDEESGACSPLGVRYLLDKGYLKAKGAIYAYASDIVCIGHRGLLRLEITTRGESVHAGLAGWHNRDEGHNAVTGLADIMLRLEKLELPAEPVPGFEHLGFTITPGTLFNGGDYASIVPNKAAGMVDIRLLPGQMKDETLEAIDEIITEVRKERPGLRVETHLLVDIPGASIAVDHPLVQLAQKYTGIVHGQEWPIRGAGPGNEGYMLIGAGIPTLCGFGPTGGKAHAPDEWVLVDSLPRIAALFAGLSAEYLKGK